VYRGSHAARARERQVHPDYDENYESFED